MIEKPRQSVIVDIVIKVNTNGDEHRKPGVLVGDSRIGTFLAKEEPQ